jgi:hypothetical protein
MKKTRTTANFLSLVGALVCAMPTGGIAQPCPLRSPTTGTVTGPLAGARPLVSDSPSMVSFRSGLSRDEDGNPRAYHRGLATAEEVDPGLDHICNGLTILELANGRLRNKYSSDGTGGSLTEGRPEERRLRARACKRDYIALRDAGFPPCGPSRLCADFYGIAVIPRQCGFGRGGRSDPDTGCGVPILQRDAQGRTNGFYLTTNTLIRPGASAPFLQSDYADALLVPFVVMPGGQRLPTITQWNPGDLAVVVWNGRVVYAVVGDSGPRASIGEASRALLQRLGTSSVEERDPATTLLFPGTFPRLRSRPWPLTADVIEEEVRRALASVPGGVASLRACPGLTALN